MTIGDLNKVFARWLRMSDPGALYCTLAAVAAHRMHHDVWLILVGPPSSGKSEVLQSLDRVDRVYPTSTMSEAALLSGTSEGERSKDATGGLLREIGEFGIIVYKDFTSMLSMPAEKQRSLLAALREIYDGSWVRRLGVDGGRNLSWKGKVGLIVGCTPIIDRHHAVMNSMGERFLIYRIDVGDEAEQQAQLEVAFGRDAQEGGIRTELANAVSKFFDELGVPPRAKLSWHDEERLKCLSTLAARGRSAVDRHPRTREIELVLPPEGPTRLALSLRGLTLGLFAIGLGTDWIWYLVVRVALDSMPSLRKSVFVLLANEKDVLGAAEISRRLAHPESPVRRALEDFEALGIVERVAQACQGSVSWKLTTWARDLYERACATPPAISEDPR